MGKLRSVVLNKLLSSQEICKALLYNEPDFLENPDIADPSALLNERIFPFNYSPDLEGINYSFLNFALRDYRPASRQFKTGLLRFKVMIHKDFVHTDYEMLRHDFIVARIDDLFYETRELGIGKMEFYKMYECCTNESYVGFNLHYKLWDFA